MFKTLATTRTVLHVLGPLQALSCLNKNLAAQAVDGSLLLHACSNRAWLAGQRETAEREAEHAKDDANDRDGRGGIHLVLQRANIAGSATG